MGKLIKYGKGTVVKDDRIEREVVTRKGCLKVVVKVDENGRYPVTRKLLNLMFNKDWAVILLFLVSYWIKLFFRKRVDGKYPFPIP